MKILSWAGPCVRHTGKGVYPITNEFSDILCEAWVGDCNTDVAMWSKRVETLENKVRSRLVKIPTNSV